MTKPILSEINDKLIELEESYGTLYPKFKGVELAYISKYDQLLMQAYNNYASQPARDAATRQQMELDFPDFEKYHSLLTEITVLDRRIKILTTISMNLKAMQWEMQR